MSQANMLQVSVKHYNPAQEAAALNAWVVGTA